ncbi:sulfite exporter TauE/SafE family protein [Sinorhizobium sp. BG8]|uniref:sulfite exporter TauE/SafE family protein n=1 Tax=Sinorhizobium sp. BG8 TaxID=2613773 RepID=UPI00193D7FA9|nr:sulfite exporter TauE/SafE family protein [Sinorhizobium sp. BG8]QRM56121.1 sulfite exporter TauE/SafE family protein [Sinorhizobium sp. BG8]
MPASLTLLTTFALVLGLVGCVSGFLAGLLGVGGGIVVVPVLYHVLAAFDVDPALRAHIAVGTSLATIIPTSFQSIRAHNARGAVDRDLLKLWAPFVAVGVVVGVLIAAYASGGILTAIFGAVAACVALYMLFTPEGWHPIAGLPGRPGQAAMATTIGTISTLMGIGGGTLTVPTLSICSYPVRRAVGTASVIGLIIALPGAIGYVINGWGKAGLPAFSFGYVNLGGLVAIVFTSMWFAPLGARTAHTIEPRTLRMLFGVFLAITSVKMLADTYRIYF